MVNSWNIYFYIKTNTQLCDGGEYKCAWISKIKLYISKEICPDGRLL